MSEDEFNQLIPLAEAVAKFVPNKVNPATVFRWTRTGVTGANGERIVLPVTYVGRRVYTTAKQLQQWIQDTTAARLHTTKKHGGNDDEQTEIR